MPWLAYLKEMKERLYDTVTHSPEETLAFGRKLAKGLQPPCTVLLEGDLGSGKTTLTKGIAAGLGAAREEDVTSPTFTLVHEYSSAASEAGGQGIKVYHVDLYRIDGLREIESLGLEELFNPWSTVLIEWGEKLPQRPPGRVVRIRMEVLGENQRRIIVERED